jgi:ribosomal protein S18 acetylase RimI-like enzyme
VSGQHRLGPHVVGQRVVLRRLLRADDGTLVTGATGGPAFTDVLGICTSWADGVAEVTPESGEPVRVALGDIVSGKPVLPRASVRQRVGVREAELHTAALWPRVLTEPLGEWQLRLDPAPVGRPRKRANSCLALGDPGTVVAAALARVTEFYAGHDREPLVQVEAGSETEAAVAAAGWEALAEGESDFLMGGVSRARRLLGRAVEVAPRMRWVIEDRCATVLLGDAAPLDGDDWAVAEATLDGDWLGLHGLVVAPEHRHRGLARQALAGLLEWGAEQGARTVWLHVETDNAAAYSLYEGLGLSVHHTCRYLRPV